MRSKSQVRQLVDYFNTIYGSQNTVLEIIFIDESTLRFDISIFLFL